MVVGQEDVRFVTHVLYPTKYLNKDLDGESDPGYDVALLYFDDNIKTKFLTIDMKTTLRLGQADLSAIGFGCNIYLEQVMLEDAELKKAYNSGLVKWTNSEPLQVKRLSQYSNSKGYQYVTNGQILIPQQDALNTHGCPGDSGGPLLKGGKMVGVLSATNFDSDTYFTALNSPGVSDFLQLALNQGTNKSSETISSIEFDRKMRNSDSMKRTFETIRNQRAFVDNLGEKEINSKLVLHYSNFRKANARNLKLVDEMGDYFFAMHSAIDGAIKSLGAIQKEHGQNEVVILPSLVQGPLTNIPRKKIIQELTQLNSHELQSNLNRIPHKYEINPKGSHLSNSNMEEIAVYAKDSENSKLLSAEDLIFKNVIVNNVQEIPNLTQQLARKHGLNKTLVVPYFTLRQIVFGQLTPGKSKVVVLIDSVSAVVIKNGKVIEQVTLFKDLL